MALSPTEEAKLYSPTQRMKCRFVAFDTLAAVNVATPGNGVYTFVDMINAYPRYSWVACSASITIDATYSQVKISKGAASGHVFTKDSGDGTVTDNEDGTCTYTAPSSGSGICYINCATTGNATGATIAVAYGETCLNVGEVTSFNASLSSGSWEMTVKAYGDCTGFDRQRGVLLVVDDYWNGSEDTFGGFLWAHGVFFGWVDRMRTVHQDADTVYLEVTIKGAKEILNYGSTPDCFFSQSDDESVKVADLEAIDAAWVFIQESGLNDQINFRFMDCDQSITNLKLETGPFMDVIDDILARTFGVVTCTKLGDIHLQGDPDVRLDKVFVSSPEFTIMEEMLQYADITWHKVTSVDDPTDATVMQVTLQAVNGSLYELVRHWPVDPRDGQKETVSGIICEVGVTLEDWAEKYWWKVNRHMEADLGFFLMHHVDLLTFLSWDFDVRGDISNFDWNGGFTGVYVSEIDYRIEPGAGTWTGDVHVLSYYNPGS